MPIIFPITKTQQYLLVGLVIALSTLFGIELHKYVGFGFTLVYPPVIAAIAATLGRRPAQFSIILCVFSYWYFVLYRQYSLIAAEEHEVVFTISLAGILFATEFLTSKLKTTNSLLEQRTVEAEEANLKLQATMQEREDFMAALSHDLKNPLIGGNRVLEILRSREKDASSIEILNQLIASNRRMLQMLWNILDSYAAQEGALQPFREPVNAKFAIQECLNELEFSMGQKKLSCAFNAEEATNCTLLVDPMLFRRAIINFLENAIRYSPAGEGIAVAVKIKGDKALLSVSNSGPGIPVEKRGLLFQKFNRNLESGRCGGTGLGLYIIRLIVEAHGGDIVYESPEVAGRSTFITTWPCDHRCTVIPLLKNVS
jgi:K+-sensing histidine kinase KdpD